MTSTLKKILAGTTGLALAASAVPVGAQDYRHYDDDGGIGAGEIIAGAVVLGGLAAILSGRDRDRDRYDDRYDRRYNSRYNRGLSERQMIERCVYAAERDASRYGSANVTEIEEIDRDGYTLRVEGDIEVYQGRSRYDRSSRYGRYDRNTDEGEFECRIDRNGRILMLDFDDLRYR